MNKLLSSFHLRPNSRRWLILAICLTFFAQLVFGAKQLSLTSDEPPHIAHGLIALTTSDTWALAEHRHPPLLNAWAAWPLLLQPELPDLYTLEGWDSDFVLFVRALWPQLGDIERLAFVTRYPNMLLALLLLALVIRWTRERFGTAAALLASIAMTFDPTMLAHSQLNTTDLGLALFTFATCYACVAQGGENTWRQPIDPPKTRPDMFLKPVRSFVPQIRLSIKNILIIGILLGLTCASKGSGVMLVPIIAVLLIAQAIQNAPHKSANPSSSARLLPSAFFLLAATFLTLWATYSFQLNALFDHAKMTLLILQEAARTTFLLGEIRQGGWWWYFPLAFVIKTPIPLLLTIGFSIIKLLRTLKITNYELRITNRKLQILHPQNLALWAFPVLYIIIAIRSGMNIGYRHLLPVFPFVYVMIGKIVGQQTSESTNRRLSIQHPASSIQFSVSNFTFYVLLLWYILGTLFIQPFPIAYFNEFVGGPKNGYHYLVDSNVDWGQSFIALKQWMDKNTVDEVHLSYYTWIDPAAYSINYQPLPPARDVGPLFPQRFAPKPGIYALSATPLQGVMLADAEQYDTFRNLEPITQLGYGLLVYEIQPYAPHRLVQCSTPAPPLTEPAIAEGFGQDNLPHIQFDCTRGWLYASNSAEWIALHQDIHDDAFVQRRLDTGRVSYEQHQPSTLPPFALYELTQAPTPPHPIDHNFGALSLIGHTITTDAIQPNQPFDIETWWRVNAIPERSLSLMLHLAGLQGQPTLVADGLAIPAHLWQVGDILVQRHTFNLPADTPTGTYQPITGIYWSDTIERWAVQTGQLEGNDHIQLTPITIE